MKGATGAANELARFLREATEGLTVREMARRYGGGKTLWSEYRSGARIIPLGRLNTVLRDRVRDARGRGLMFDRARRLHDAALAAEVERAPGRSLEEALQRAQADLAESGRLVQTLLAIITMLQEQVTRSARTGTADTVTTPSAPTRDVSVAEAEPDRLLVHLETAFHQLGTAWSLQTAARQTYADAQARSRECGEGATAGTELTLALARVGSALELHRESIGRLWSDTRAVARAHEVVEGVVLERVDNAVSVAPVSSVVEEWHPDALPGPSASPGRPRALAIAAVAASLALALVAVATAVGVVTGSRQHTTTRALSGEPGTVPTPPAPAAKPAAKPSAPPAHGTPTQPPAAAPTASGTPPRTAPSTKPSAPASRPPSVPTALPAPLPPPPSAAPIVRPSAPPLPDGLLRLTNIASRMCLAAPRGSVTPAEGLVQTGCGADFEQFWQLTHEGAGPAGPVYAVRNRHNGLCLSVDAARTTNDAVITQYSCGDENGLFPDQFWSFRYNATYRAWHLVNRNSGKCVSVRSGGGDLEQALQGECADDPWLLWRT
ncbi:RICIN domain-containing protein [Streptomyces sp. NPDC000410]|uniref:RICIN domain-containing protein n=1 Tax=Streptomyces sp. NPDC000410 TaxID=3154254 RepID=UPI00332C506D